MKSTVVYAYEGPDTEALELSDEIDQQISEVRERVAWSSFGTIGFEGYLQALNLPKEALRHG